MKKKSGEEKQIISLNESSGQLLEPSFSKITFRKRGHFNDSEAMSDIGEEENSLREGLNQAGSLDNNNEHQTKKRKKKSAERVNIEYLNNKLNPSNDSCTGGKGDEDHSVINLESEFNSTERLCSVSDSYNPNSKKRKKKKNKYSSEIVTQKLSIIGENEGNQNIDIGVETELNEENYMESTDKTDVCSKKKKKKKHHPKELVKQLEEQHEEKYHISPSHQTEPSIKKIKTKHNRLKPNYEDFEVSRLTSESTINDSINMHQNKIFESKSNPRMKNWNNETPLYCEESLKVTADGYFGSPLIVKKKKIKKLMDESNLEDDLIGDDNTSDISRSQNTINSPHSHKKKRKSMSFNESSLSLPSYDQFQEQQVVTEDNVHGSFYISQNLPSAKKLKKKLKLSNKTSEKFENSSSKQESLENNNDDGIMKGPVTECSPIHSQINKIKCSTITTLESQYSSPAPLLLETKIKDIENIENGSKFSKKSKKSRNLSQDNFNPTTNNNCKSEERDNNCFESKIVDSKEVKLKKNKKPMQLNKNLSVEKHIETKDIKKKSKVKRDKDKGDVETLKNQLLKDAFSGIKESKDLSLKSTKPKKVDSLRKQLLQQALGCLEKSESSQPKSTKVKTVVEDNILSPRKCLPQDAFGEKQHTKDKPLIPNKLKVSVDQANKVHKGKNKIHLDLKVKVKKNRKIKHKGKSNDIDKLTDVLISRALEKVSSSGASHSSQENINCLDVEKINGADSKTQSENKMVKDHPTKKKLNRSDKISAKHNNSESNEKTEREKMQKALLNSALKNLKSEFKPSKVKIKKSKCC